MEDLRKKTRFRIRTKMLIAFLGLSVISLMVFGYFALSDISRIGQYALESSSSLGHIAADDSAKALETLGEKIITQKAMDVALQCRIFLDISGRTTIQELQKNREFQKIAVQPVGKTGYTIIYERKTGLLRLHPNPELIDTPVTNFRETLPEAWKIFEKTFDGSASNGYYNWKDPDGQIRPKYMSIVPVEGTLYMVAATTYIDEFSLPVKETRRQIAATTQKINAHIQEALQDIYQNFVAFFIVLILVVLTVAYYLSRTITTPIVALVRGVKAIGRGEIDCQVNIKTNDEFAVLATAFNKMSLDLQEHMDNLERTTAVKEGLLKELEIARDIQQRLLPEQAPVIDGVDLAANNLPVREVGGDFFDFIPITKDKWGLVIADVSGKGMPAAMFMGLSRTMVRASATAAPEPVQTIKQANELICRDSTSGMFVTLFYGVLDNEKRLRYINAGHNPPLLFRQGTDQPIFLKGHGIALGVKPSIEIEESEIALLSKDVLVLYTDGVTEAINEQEEAFGVDRLIHILKDVDGLSAREIIKRIQQSVLSFAGSQKQFDDITLMVLRVKS